MTDTRSTDAPRWGTTVVVGTVQGYPCRMYAERPRSLADFLQTGRRWAGRELLVQGERRLTSAEHERAVARVAALLGDHGVGRGDRVAIVGFNTVEWVVTFWAVQALGATAVLGNAWWSDGELEQALAAAGPDLVVTDRQVAYPRLGLLAIRAAVDDGEQRPLVIAPVGEDDLAVIMFSSGTTGAAQGVLMSHRAVVANIQNLLALTGRLPDDLPPDHPGTVSMLSVPLFHLAGLQVLCTTLLSGGRLVLLEGRFDAGEVLRLIETEGVRVWGSIPTMVSRVLDHPDFAATDTSSLTSVPMGGSAVSVELRERVSAAFSGVRNRVGSLYGLTEAGGVLAAGSGADVAGRPQCVGRPLPVVELRIRDPDASGTGEIQARTPTATGGYLGDDRRLVDPDGWLSTGDLGYLDDEGRLYVTGRSKDIIIRGGENVSAVHVEDVLLTHPDVLEAAVVALPHPDLGEEVGAAVVTRPGASVGAEALVAHARLDLATFEVPGRWWLRTEPLPLNPSGKVLRREVLRAWLSLEGGSRDDR